MKLFLFFQDSKLRLKAPVWNHISWNLCKMSTHLSYSDDCYFHFFIGFLIELKFCQVSRNSFSNRFWKSQLFILKNKKVLFFKKNLSRCQYQNKNDLFTDPIFSEGFGYHHYRSELHISLEINSLVQKLSKISQKYNFFYLS